MFKIAESPEFTHTVPVMVPVDGGHREDTLTVRYRVLPIERADDFDLNTGQGTVDFLKAVVAEVGDVVGPDDKPLPWNDRLRDQLFGLYYVRLALVNAYLKAVMKARMGN